MKLMVRRRVTRREEKVLWFVVKMTSYNDIGYQAG